MGTGGTGSGGPAHDGPGPRQSSARHARSHRSSSASSSSPRANACRSAAGTGTPSRNVGHAAELLAVFLVCGGPAAPDQHVGEHLPERAQPESRHQRGAAPPPGPLAGVARIHREQDLPHAANGHPGTQPGRAGGDADGDPQFPALSRLGELGQEVPRSGRAAYRHAFLGPAAAADRLLQAGELRQHRGQRLRAAVPRVARDERRRSGGQPSRPLTTGPRCGSARPSPRPGRPAAPRACCGPRPAPPGPRRRPARYAAGARSGRTR